MGRLNASPWGVLSLSPSLLSWLVFSPREPYRDGVQETARVQNDTFVCIAGTCGDVYRHFFTSWPNYPRQFSVMQRYLIWKVHEMFHEIIISGFFFSFTIQLIIIPWTLDMPRPCLKVEFVMLEAGSLAALLTSLESLAFQRGQRWRAAAPLSEGKVSELTGNVKSDGICSPGVLLTAKLITYACSNRAKQSVHCLHVARNKINQTKSANELEQQTSHTHCFVSLNV